MLQRIEQPISVNDKEALKDEIFEYLRSDLTSR